MPMRTKTNGIEDSENRASEIFISTLESPQRIHLLNRRINGKAVIQHLLDMLQIHLPGCPINLIVPKNGGGADLLLGLPEISIVEANEGCGTFDHFILDTISFLKEHLKDKPDFTAIIVNPFSISLDPNVYPRALRKYQTSPNEFMMSISRSKDHPVILYAYPNGFGDDPTPLEIDGILSYDFSKGHFINPQDGQPILHRQEFPEVWEYNGVIALYNFTQSDLILDQWDDLAKDYIEMDEKVVINLESELSLIEAQISMSDHFRTQESLPAQAA